MDINIKVAFRPIYQLFTPFLTSSYYSLKGSYSREKLNLLEGGIREQELKIYCMEIDLDSCLFGEQDTQFLALHTDLNVLRHLLFFFVYSFIMSV